MPEISFLALDIATKTGWCVYAAGAWHSGVWNMNRRSKHKVRDEEYSRLVKIRDNLDGVKLRFPEITHIGWEKVNFSKFALAHGVWSQLYGVVQLWRQDNGITEANTHEIGTTSLKKHATGSGRAEKPEMIQAAQRLWPGLVCEDDNEADARLVAAWMSDKLRIGID